MVSIKLKFRKSKTTRKDGHCFVQLVHQRKVRTITTGVQLKVTEWDFVRGCINLQNADEQRRIELAQYKETLQGIVNTLQEIVNDFCAKGEAFNISMIVRAYLKYGMTKSFLKIMEARISELKNNGQYRTAINYQNTMRMFDTFCRNANILTSDITETLMKRFETYLRKKGNSINTISFYMRILRATYYYAVAQDRIRNPQSPFKSVYTGNERTLKRAVSVKVIHLLNRLELDGEPRLELARDLFMFSIYTRGMAFVDLAHLQKTDIKNNVLVYRRRKTNQLFQILLPDCAKKIMDKYAAKVKDVPFLFPILHSESQQNYDSAIRLYNRCLNKLSSRMGGEVRLTSYVARHTWATLAKNQGVEIHIISEALGHTSEQTTRIYLDSINNELINQANDKVIAALCKYKD